MNMLYTLNNASNAHNKCVCVHAKLLQLCLTVCDPMDCSPPGSSVHGIPQARIQQWIAIPSSRGSSQPWIKPVSLVSPALGSRFFTTSTTWDALINVKSRLKCLAYVASLLGYLRSLYNLVC